MDTDTSSTKKSSKFSTGIVLALFVYVIGFWAATTWDLPLDLLLYSPTNPFAIFMEAFGWYPAFLVFVFYCATWYAKLRKDGKLWQKLLPPFLAFVTLAIMAWDSIRRLTTRGWLTGFTDWRCLFCILFVVLLGYLLFSIACKAEPKTQEKFSFFGFWGTIYLAANQVVMFLLKTLWQRTRFDEMLAIGNYSDFTPWYIPFGNGGNSFPSGHTANAAGLFVLVILCDLFPSWNKKRKWVYALIWVYVILMAFSRILIGRHFLSDTLAASGIMAILFFILRRTSYYQKGIKKFSE